MESVTSLIFHFIDIDYLAIQIEGIWILLSTDEAEYLSIHEREVSCYVFVLWLYIHRTISSAFFIDLLSVLNIVSEMHPLGCM